MSPLRTALVAAMLAACAPMPTDTPAPPLQRPLASEPLDGTQWGLVAIGGETVSRAAAGTTLNFGEDGAGGTGPCNLYGSEPVIGANNSIAFGSVIATERACFPISRNESESAYLAALRAAATYSNDGETLILFGKNGAELLRFGKAPQQGAVDEALIDTRWSLGDLLGSPAFGLASIGFNTNGELEGTAPCNLFGGDYRLGTEREITILAFPTTRCACADFDREEQFFDALRRTEAWRIDGERLLLSAGDATLMILERLRELPPAIPRCGG